MLTKFLRAHQREGLQFLFDCVCGLKAYEGQGWYSAAKSLRPSCTDPLSASRSEFAHHW